MTEINQIIQRILFKIKDEWNKEKKNLLPEITFEDFKYLCLRNLDLANTDSIKDFKITEYATQKKFVCPYCKRGSQ